MPSAKQSTKGIEGKEWKELCCHDWDMSMTTGAKQPSESQKAKAFWAMKRPGTGVRNIMIQLAMKISWAEQKLAWIWWEAHLKDPIVALEKSVGMLGESATGSAFGCTVCRGQSLSSQWRAASLVRRFCKRCGGPHWEGVWPCLDPWDVVRLRTSSRCWNDPGK